MWATGFWETGFWETGFWEEPAAGSGSQPAALGIFFRYFGLSR